LKTPENSDITSFDRRQGFSGLGDPGAVGATPAGHKQSSMNSLIWYYRIRPFIPRRLQITLRRFLAGQIKHRSRSYWPIRWDAAKAPKDWAGWPQGKKFALVLTHDVDTAIGRDRCRDLKRLEEDRDFRSSFNFVPADYAVPPDLRAELAAAGFEIGIHGLTHDARLFMEKKRFDESAPKINAFLRDWGVVGFNAPCMVSNLEWIAKLEIEYDNSTFDTDPFEPKSEGVATIFPFVFQRGSEGHSYVELPYTLPQDHALFIILREKTINIWKKKLAWIAEKGGMALLNTHPDYMRFKVGKLGLEDYPATFYADFLDHIKENYAGQYWHVLPKQMARFWRSTVNGPILLTDRGSKVPSSTASPKRIWIDLDNTPHVPFFIPIIRELKARGFKVFLTARDAFQVCELADQQRLDYQRIGRHWGKQKAMKVFGWLLRSARLAPFALRTKPSLALSHGSRSQALIANLLGIPTVMIADYEHARSVPFAIPDWEISPDVIPAEELPSSKVLKYQGLKEDVYVPFFEPNPSLLDELGLNDDDLVVTVRPPATEAHYHNPESEVILRELMQWLLTQPLVKIVLLPRDQKQGEILFREHPTWMDSKRVILPARAVDGLNLIFFSDLVISGGGTMNREAAALGIPVYSIFRGPLGEVDRHLVAEGRLTMISSPNEISTKIKLLKRSRSLLFEAGERPALSQIIQHIEMIFCQTGGRKRRRCS
jgi:predicted glycosyltransferase/peptidoglycan/xylan/chitin deacetylase (PgdA/CDA1 family)